MRNLLIITVGDESYYTDKTIDLRDGGIYYGRDIINAAINQGAVKIAFRGGKIIYEREPHTSGESVKK